jgi:predicted HAD superfamily phosphohydrolase YqeG
MRWSFSCFLGRISAGVRPLIGLKNAQGEIPRESAMVGDRIDLDVIAANRAQVTSIIVEPVQKEHIWLVLRASDGWLRRQAKRIE